MSGFLFRIRQSAKIRYLLQSGTIFALNLAVMVALHEWLGVSKNFAFAIAILTVIATGFLSLKYFVYQAPGGNIGREFLAYLPSVGMFALLQYLIFITLHDTAGVDYRIANICAQGTTFVSKFFFYRAFVFRRSGESITRSAPGTDG